MKLTELIDRVEGLTPRQVRFLVAEGFVPPPRGGRALAEYGEDHLAAILRYQALREAGLPPSAIRVVLALSGGLPVPIAPGLALLVDRTRLDPSLDPAEIARRTAEILTPLLQETHDAAPDPTDPA